MPPIDETNNRVCANCKFAVEWGCSMYCERTEEYVDPSETCDLHRYEIRCDEDFIEMSDNYLRWLYRQELHLSYNTDDEE